MAKTLQGQGVPIPSKLNGPQPRNIGSPNGPQSRTYRTTTRSRGSSPRRSTGNAAQSVGNRQSRNTSRPSYNPATVGSNASSSVGLLEAEFILGFGLLILLMFTNTSATTSARIMSTMKRGTLLCLLFFFLALISGIGPNAAKFSKAFGGLAVVAILVTSPMSKGIVDVDNIIKNDWVPTGETGTDTAAISSADAGTNAGTSGAAAGAAQITSGLTGELEALAKTPKAQGSVISQAAINTLNGIIPGLGNLVSNGGVSKAESVIKGILSAL
jgi:hypothetical protein